MVRLELGDERGIKGILIDGYMPDFSYLKQVDWERAMEEKLSLDPDFRYNFRRYTYNRYLKPERDIPSIHIQSTIYKKLIGSLTHRFCSLDREACAKYSFPSRGHRRIERIISMSRKKLRDYLPIFSREIEKDEIEGKRNYFLHITLLDLRPGKECQVFEECNKNWMEFLNFKIKEKADYKNFDEFKKASEALLKYYVDFVIEELFESKE